MEEEAVCQGRTVTVRQSRFWASARKQKTHQVRNVLRLSDQTKNPTEKSMRNECVWAGRAVSKGLSAGGLISEGRGADEAA